MRFAAPIFLSLMLVAATSLAAEARHNNNWNRSGFYNGWNGSRMGRNCGPSNGNWRFFNRGFRNNNGRHLGWNNNNNRWNGGSRWWR